MKFKWWHLALAAVALYFGYTFFFVKSPAGTSGTAAPPAGSS